MSQNQVETLAPTSEVAAPPTPQKFYFLKSGDSRDPVINGIKPVFTQMGDGYGYFVTTNEEIARVLLDMANKQKGGIQVTTIAEIKEKKTTCLARQSEIDRRRELDRAFQAPGLQFRNQPNQHSFSPPLLHPVQSAAAVAANGAHKSVGILRDAPQKNLLPPVAPVEPPKAEPIPEGCPI